MLFSHLHRRANAVRVKLKQNDFTHFTSFILASLLFEFSQSSFVLGSANKVTEKSIKGNKNSFFILINFNYGLFYISYSVRILTPDLRGFL